MLFPTLYVNDEIRDRVRPQLTRVISDTLIVGVQHLLDTTGSLIESLIEMGAQPANILLCGKCYSTNASVLDRLHRLGITAEPGNPPIKPGAHLLAMQKDVDLLWESALSAIHWRSATRVIILDDGGLCISKAADSIGKRIPVIGIEQTTSGLGIVIPAKNFPVIQVASCAVKRILEPPMIAAAVLARLMRELQFGNESEACGVIGTGNIGKAIVQALLQRGHRVFVFDKNTAAMASIPSAVVCANSQEVFSRTDYVFGCTGEDCLSAESAIATVNGLKTMVSCSSHDVEFRSVLQHVGGGIEPRKPHDPTRTIYFKTATGGQLRIVRGGFPANFDGAPASVPANDIQLTRGLLFGALVQAMLSDHSVNELEPAGQMLSPYIQKFVVSKWLGGNSDADRESKAREFTSVEWIARHSSGKLVGDPRLQALFQ